MSGCKRASHGPTCAAGFNASPHTCRQIERRLPAPTRVREHVFINMAIFVNSIMTDGYSWATVRHLTHSPPAWEGCLTSIGHH